MKSTEEGKYSSITQHRLNKFGFVSTFNMGYEGFSKPLPLLRQNPVWGNKNEFLALLLLIGIVPLIAGARKSNESALRSEVHTTNRYSHLHLASQYRQPSKWEA